jgi:hypothetical protein
MPNGKSEAYNRIEAMLEPSPEAFPWNFWNYPEWKQQWDEYGKSRFKRKI